MWNVWGETIKNIRAISLLAIVFLSVSAMAHEEAIIGTGGTDILGDGIFETDNGAFRFPISDDTNFDSVQVGNDKATAFGSDSGFPFGFRNGPAKAENNLEIKKNQDSGKCKPCVHIENVSPYESIGLQDGTNWEDSTNWDDYLDPGYGRIDICGDSCIKANIEQIKVGNREALAFGLASATNNVKIVTNQV